MPRFLLALNGPQLVLGRLEHERAAEAGEVVGLQPPLPVGLQQP
eukprot:CAMPEP_0206401756 /NCGR_PEP_ID=MMETSP0294-20121207/26496_1 /ASSEMBLY_ACC=CAM_ASM_000327 /TAXON_ID=39354 /ORGANISM="Heterosigma akashiwo, Strain CCMP2393" /LENGTH=43 /DNA_ID= /DNA_START= /DNA_END= /DNA_ORIENTATION=